MSLIEISVKYKSTQQKWKKQPWLGESKGMSAATNTVSCHSCRRNANPFFPFEIFDKGRGSLRCLTRRQLCKVKFIPTTCCKQRIFVKVKLI